MVNTCYYHNPCSDGIAAAWTVRLKYPEANFIGISAGNTKYNIDEYKDKNVMFVDCCPPTKEIITTILNDVKSLIIIDHHITNQEVLAKIKDSKLTVRYDINLSGCQLTWNYINGNSIKPWFIDYIGDRDLWKWKLPNSKLINLGLYEMEYITSFEGIDSLFEKSTNDWRSMDENWFINKELLPLARIIDNKNKQKIEYASERASHVYFPVNGHFYKIWLCGGVDSSLTSELGDTLANKEFPDGTMPDFSAIWSYSYNRNEWRISLRSISTDVSQIAKKFWGGGHKMAAGLTFKGLSSLREHFIPIPKSVFTQTIKYDNVNSNALLTDDIDEKITNSL